MVILYPNKLKNLSLGLLLSLSLYAEDPWEFSHSQKPRTSSSPAIYFIRLYQQQISPICGPRSHYLPTSSEYMRQSILHHGFFKGYILGCDRLLRENNDEWLYKRVRTRAGFTKWDPALPPVKQ